MKQVSMHEAKTHLSRLVQGAVDGEPFVIARAGKPLVKVVPVDPPVRRPFGGMEGEYEVPEDFNTMLAEEIRAMFEDGPLFPPGRDERGHEAGDEEASALQGDGPAAPP